MKHFYVYVYRDPSRGDEPIYVGKGQDDRAYVHLNDAQNNHFKNRLAKMKANGIEPIINVIDMPSEALALQCEIDTIARLGRKDLKLGPLLNMTDGGEGVSGWVPTEENRKNMSDAKKGKSPSGATKHKMSAARKGQPKSAETRQKMSAAAKGKSASPETRRRMSDAKKGKLKTICPHCGILTGPSRWHFDSCKQKM